MSNKSKKGKEGFLPLYLHHFKGFGEFTCGKGCEASGPTPTKKEICLLSKSRPGKEEKEVEVEKVDNEKKRIK